VELTQAQLNVTQAEIENLSANYDYQTQYSALQYTLASSDRTVFREVQRFPLRRIGMVIAIPPLCMLGLLIRQVMLGHRWDSQPMSNANVIG